MKRFNTLPKAVMELEDAMQLLAHSTEISCDEPIRKAQTLFEALNILMNVMLNHSDVDYFLSDIMDDLRDFAMNEIPYTSFWDGNKCTIRYDALEYALNLVFVLNPTYKTILIPEEYTVGNEAIGQIFIENSTREAFSIKHAVNHSLNSMAKRWLEIAIKIRHILSETN